MKIDFSRYNNVFLVLFRNLFFTFFLFLILKFIPNVNVIFLLDLNFLVFFLFLFGFLWLFFYFKKDEEYFKNKFENYFKYSFLFFLLLITISSLDFEILKRYEILKLIIEFSNHYIYYLTLLAVGSGFFTFYFNKERVEEKKGIKKEKTNQNKIYLISTIVAFVIFLALRLSMFRFTGNYPDEWNHIIAAMDLLEEGNLGGYTRYAHISFLTSVYFFLFGISLTTAKLVPITLGFINFFMLHHITKALLKNKTLRIIYLLLIAFFPWTIFNHFYIRGYIFTEFVLILLLFLGLQLIKQIEKNASIIKITGIALFMLSITFIHYQFGWSNTDLILFIPLIVQIFYIFTIFRTKKGYKLNQLIDYSLNKINKRYVLFILSLLVIVVFYFNTDLILRNINTWQNFQTNTSAGHINFSQFFFDLNIIFTILAILSTLSLFFIRNKKLVLFFLTIIPLLTIHATSNESLQIIRGTMYIYPLFLLSSFIILDHLAFARFKIPKLFFPILIILFFYPSIINQYNLFLFEKDHPRIPSEIAYHEYSKTYESLEELTKKGYITLVADYNIQKEIFYKHRFYYKLDFVGRLEDHYTHYNDDNGITRQLKTNTPVITDFKKLQQMTQEQKNCIKLKNYSHSHFLGDRVYNYILVNYDLTHEAIGSKIYCN